jgi:hypothetical protein
MEIIKDKEWHLKNLAEKSKIWYENSLKQEDLEFAVDGTVNVYRNGKLITQEPSEEDERWIKHKMFISGKNWKRWYDGIYFTDEEREKLGLPHIDKGMS